MLRRHILHFAIAGTLGFVIDAGLVQLLTAVGRMDPYLARVLSVAVAVLATFSYNRLVTFRDRRGSGGVTGDLGRYLLGNAAGLSVNYGAYAAAVAVSAHARAWPVLAVALGSLAGMGVNFLAARHFVWARTP